MSHVHLFALRRVLEWSEDVDEQTRRAAEEAEELDQEDDEHDEDELF